MFVVFLLSLVLSFALPFESFPGGALGILAWNSSVFSDLIFVVSRWNGASSIRITILANGHGVTLETLEVGQGAVRSTAGVGDYVVVHPLEGVQRLASVAAVVHHVAVEEDLRRDVDFRELAASHDRDTIRDTGSGGLCPA